MCNAKNWQNYEYKNLLLKLYVLESIIFKTICTLEHFIFKVILWLYVHLYVQWFKKTEINKILHVSFRNHEELYTHTHIKKKKKKPPSNSEKICWRHIYCTGDIFCIWRINFPFWFAAFFYACLLSSFFRLDFPGVSDISFLCFLLPD